jgi:AcrR family transcriptional regulator
MPKEYERTDVRRRQIAEAALDVIAEQGLGRFTAKTVADRVGIADGSIFRHFANKKEIVLAAMDLVEETLFPDLESANEEPLTRLESFFKHRAKVIGTGGSVGRLVFSNELAHATGQEGWERIRSWRRRSLGLVLDCLHELGDMGRLKEGLSPNEAAQVIQGRLLALMLERSMLQSAPPDIEERISKAWVALRHLLFV